EQVDGVSEAGQQITPGFVRVRGEAIEAEPIDQQVRHLAALLLERHVAIELLIDDLQLLGSERAGILVGAPEGCVVEELLAPDVRTDQGKVAPACADLPREFPLQRPQGALTRGGGPLRVDYERAF